MGKTQERSENFVSPKKWDPDVYSSSIGAVNETALALP